MINNPAWFTPQPPPELAIVIDLDSHRPTLQGDDVTAPTRITYTVPEVATQLGISSATTYVLLRTGQIPARRIGSRWIIPCRRFDAWLEIDPVTTQPAEVSR
jgi:excisionase family DNA binding protein